MTLLKYLLVAIISASVVFAEDNTDSKAMLPIGNFSLDESHMPEPLVGFGENIVAKGELQFYLFADAYIGNSNHTTDIIPALLYGITDDFSVRFNLGYAPSNKDACNKSSGIEDIIVQLEYAFYTQSCKCYMNQATILGAVSFPTGSNVKNPPTGYGSSSCMLGLTYNHTEIDWFYFGALGAVIMTQHKAFKSGDQFLYQCGFGRNICTPPGWIYAWMTEVIGQYEWQSTANNHKNPNSGGNTISVVPSLWVSSERLILQLGIGYPIVQELMGNQSKQYCSLFFNFAWRL